jgi:hypothetical protein
MLTIVVSRIVVMAPRTRTIVIRVRRRWETGSAERSVVRDAVMPLNYTVQCSR